ncbi:MAG TPA: insulinase family protein, partial [Caulobacteraceae bacterium]|nr:insulinase family protein [Caulobacteraceae bacterium]
MKFKSLTTALAVVTASVLVSLGSTARGGVAPTVALAPNQWAQSASDLAPDPQVRFGRLANGMTYALMHNATPSGQASVRLRIAAGSLMERDDQQGLAHVLEHMAFNGSTHVPTGEMVKILERHGLAFGADTNASTSHLETVYKLDLPKTDADTIDTSLMLLREIAGELTLPQEALDKERGVVLSEERLGDNPNYRIYKNRLKFLLPDQLASSRLPIGQVDVIRNASRETLKDFYDKNYRPERATLVVVGDFDLNAMEAKIKTRFGDWTNSHPAGGDIDLGSPRMRDGEAKVVVEPGAAMSIQLAWTGPADTRPETRARDREDIVRDLALAVLNRRLGRLSRQASPPFISASAGRGGVFDSAIVTTIQVMAEPDGWRTALTAVEHEQRRLAQYGVLKSELDREIEDYLTALRQRVTAASTRRTPALADMFVAAVGQRAVIRDPSQDLAQFEQDEKGVSVQEVSLAARNLFAGAAPLLFMSTPKPIEGGETTLAAAYRAVQADAVSAPTMVADKAWPYEAFGGPGKIVERRDVTEFGAVMVRFANGVRLTVKPTQYRRNEADVQVRFGNGRLDLPKSAPSPVWAGSALIEGGLKQLTAEDIDQTLNKKVVGANFAVDDDAFVLSGAAQSTDLDTQLQLLTAYVVEPAFRPEAFERMRVYGQTLNSQYDATASGVLRRDLPRLLHDGDERWATPSNDVIAASKAADLKALLTQQMDRGPIEVLIVGDVDVEHAIAATSATFGALHRTAAQDAPASDGRVVAFPKVPGAPIIERHRG